MQLFEFLANQFNTINNTLKSIDLSLKKLVEKQSQNTLPQYISLTPAVIENPQIHSLVKKEPITEVLNHWSRLKFDTDQIRGSTEEAELWSERLWLKIYCISLLDKYYTSLVLMCNSQENDHLLVIIYCFLSHI